MLCAGEPPRAVIPVVLVRVCLADAHQLPVVVITVFPVQHRVTERVTQQLPGGTVARALLIRTEVTLRFPVQAVRGGAVCQTVVVIVLLCRFTVHRAVAEAVRRIIVPPGQNTLILAADKLSDDAVVVALRPAVKTGLLHQPVQCIIRKGHAAVVLVDQPGDAPGRIVTEVWSVAYSGGEILAKNRRGRNPYLRTKTSDAEIVLWVYTGMKTIGSSRRYNSK